MNNLAKLGRRTCRAGLIGVPVLMLVGLVLWLLWVVVSLASAGPVDWSPVVWTWAALFFVSATLGMFGGHWNRRVADWWHGRAPSASQLSSILTMSMILPIPAFIVMVTRMRNDGVPEWLWVLAGFTVVLGMTTAVDRHRLFGVGDTVGGAEGQHPRG
jgi:ABC-type Na+ efflux pump permease subunit